MILKNENKKTSRTRKMRTKKKFKIDVQTKILIIKYKTGKKKKK